MSAAYPAYVEVIDFLASGTTPEDLIAFRPSLAVQSRVEDLVAREKSGSLTDSEKQELADTLQLEHLLIMAKAQARLKLSGAVADHR
jgi:hypothetical protein